MQVVDAACGFGFTIFLVKSPDGTQVYGTGINTDSQIGNYLSKRNVPLEFIFYPTQIQLPASTNKKLDILKVSAGRAHLLILTTDGLFTLGNNSYGQCGREIVKEEDYKFNSIVHYIPYIHGKKIVDVQCGQDHR